MISSVIGLFFVFGSNSIMKLVEAALSPSAATKSNAESATVPATAKEPEPQPELGFEEAEYDEEFPEETEYVEGEEGEFEEEEKGGDPEAKTCAGRYPNEKGIVFKDPNGKCYSCGIGFVRSAAAVTASNACTMGKNEKIFKYPVGIQSKSTKKGSHCPSGYKLDPNQKCWKCTGGFKRWISSVNSSKACRKPNKNIFKSAAFKKASFKGKACSRFGKNAFKHGSQCYTCPTGFNRSAALIGSKAACVRKGGCPKLKPKAGYATPFEHLLGGDCYSCKTGFGRTVAGITAKNACHGTLKQSAKLLGDFLIL